MNVHIYPEIRVQRIELENGAIRWQLLGSATPTEEVERAEEIDGPVLKRVEAPRKCAEQIPEQLEGRVLKLLEPTQDEDIYRIPAGLWKRDDDYFQGDRYDPDGITGYKTVQNQEPSVDGHFLREDEDGLRIYCGPYDDGTGDTRCADLPLHGTERIECIELSSSASKMAAQKIDLILKSQK